MAQQQMILPVGALVRDPEGNRYVVEGLLGLGGFGAVYLVRSRQNKEEQFALKEVIDPNQRDHERFMFESDVLKRLNHHALPRVYSVFENDKLKRIYMLMKYVPGQNLEDLLKEQPDQCFSLPLSLAIMSPIVDAIKYLHQQNPPIVHRDIKPANIVVPIKGEGAVLVDFGIAKEYVAEKTTTIIRHGSPGYAALEQYGSGTTPRTDIYALAATLYTLLSGTVPPDAIARVTEKKQDPLTPLIFLAPNLSVAVAETIQQAMSINSEDRFATIEEFWQELLDHASGDETPEEKAQVQAQLRSLVKDSTSIRLLHPVPEQELQHVRFTTKLQQPTIPLWKKRGAFLISGIAIAFLLLLFITISFSLLALHNAQLSSSHLAHSLTAATAQTPSTTDGLTPQTTPSPVGPVYPALASTYSGSIGDLLTSETTPMHLSSVQQHQGKISGFFQGLGQSNTFIGTVSSSGNVHFTVKIYNGSSTLDFEGVIKIGGDIAGNFYVLNQNGQRTGESGLWNVASTS